MANKKKLHHILKILRKIHYSVLLLAALACGVSALYGLRANNQQMIQLRAAVFEADEKNTDIEGALTSLRSFVHSHMNTNLSAGVNAVKPPIQLKYQYERLNAGNKAAYDDATKKMLADAERICADKVPGAAISQERLNCAKEYAAANPVRVQSIPEDLYKFDFVSPVWSPDQAGWSLFGAGLFLLLFVIRLLSELAIRRELKSRI